MDIAAFDIPARARPLARAVPATAVLAGLVAASWAVRTLLAFGHETPTIFADEYIYAELARSFAETGLPLVRGAYANFPALLAPLLAAPLWLPGDAELAYRLTQALQALLMSLAAVPVYLTARLLAVGPTASLLSAAVAVAAPGLVYSAYVLSDPLGYVLALTTVYAGVRVLQRPTLAGQLGVLALGGLVTLARVQYAVLPAAFVVAALVLYRRNRFRRVRVTAVVAGVGLLAAVALGPARLLGTYWIGLQGQVSPADMAAWLGRDALLFTLSAGVALVPGAVVGVAGGLLRPRSAAEHAFAVFVGCLAAALFLGAALVAAADSNRYQERYLIVLVPLGAIACAISFGRGRAAGFAAAGLALALLFAELRLPVSGYVHINSISDSPALWGARRLLELLGPADGSLVVVLAATLLLVTAAARALARAASPVPLLALAAVALAAISVGAQAFDVRNTAAYAAQRLQGEPDWVDRAGLGPAALLQPQVSSGAHALLHLFWNRSVDRVLLLPDARPPDQFAYERVAPAGDGRLLVDGRPVRTPLLVDAWGATVELEGAMRVATQPGFELWRPAGTPRLRLLALGRYADEWLASRGRITVWPDASGRTVGTLRMTVWLPDGFAETELTLETGLRETRTVVRPGKRRTVAISLDARGPVTVGYSSDRALWDGRRSVGVRAAPPTFERAA